MSRYTLNKSEHDEPKKFELLPKGSYVFQIIDYKETDKDGNVLVSKAGDPKISLMLEVVAPDEHVGRKVFHNLVFYRPESPSIKGIGMTRHFLKCAGLPYQGDLDCDPQEFLGKRIRATIIHNGEYANLDKVEIDESLSVKNNVDVPATPADVAWEE